MASRVRIASRLGSAHDITSRPLCGRKAAFQQTERGDVDLSSMFREHGVEIGGRMLACVEPYLHAFDDGYHRHRACIHKSTTSRAGSSKISFTRTRNVTASRPSTTRWSWERARYII